MFKLLSPFIKNILSEAIEHGIAALCVFFAAHGVSQQAVSGFQALFNVQSIVAAIFFVANYLYAAYRKNQPPTPPAAAHGATGLVIAALLLSGASAKASDSWLTPPDTDNARWVSAQTTASTNATTPVLSLPGITIGGSLPTNVVQTANDLLPLAAQLWPYLTNISGVSLDMDGIYSSGNKLGFLGSLNFTIPELATNYFSLGFAGEDVANKFVFAPVDVKLGVPVKVASWLTLYPFTAPGPAFMWRSQVESGLQDVSGAAVYVTLSKGWFIVVDGGTIVYSGLSKMPASNMFGGARIGVSF